MKSLHNNRLRIVAAVCTAAVIALAGCGEDAAQPAEKPPPVVVVGVQPRTFRSVLHGVGTLQAAQRIGIRPDAAGHVRQIRFQRGQAVQADQVLFVLDDAELQDRLDARQSELDRLQVRLGKAERSWERVSRAHQRGAATAEELDRTQSEMDALQAQVDTLNAQIALTRERIANTRVRAPVAGEISDHLVDVGDYVGRGDLLATLFSREALEVRFSVGQQAIGKVRTGQPVRLTVDAWPDEVFTGTLAYVSPSVQASSRQLPVVAVVDDPRDRLKPGVFASAALVIETRRDVPAVPEECLVATRDGYMVFVVRDSTAQSQPVEVGLREPGWAEITDGLELGESVVRSGHLRLRDGQPVRVSSPATRASTQPTTTRPAATQPDAARSGQAERSSSS